jgi:hypothetical protein
VAVGYANDQRVHWDRIREVFEALAPVLITGVAVNWKGEEFRIFEGVTAADC